jgi:hypothetical protein
LGKWRYTTGAQSNEDSQNIRRKKKGDLEMKAYKITGTINGRQFESYYTGKNKREIIQDNLSFWAHSNIQNVRFEEMTKEMLVSIIRGLM